MFKFSKMISAVCLLALLSMAVLSGCGKDSQKNSSPGVMGKDVAAIVNGVEISMDDLNNCKEQYKKQYAAWGLELTDESWEGLKEECLDTLIENELLKQEMEKADLKVDVEGEYKYYVSKYGGELAFKKALQESGYTREAFLAELEKSLVHDTMYEQVTKDAAKPDQAEIAAYYADNQERYKEYQTRHVLFLTSSEDEKQSEAETKADALAKAKTVISRLDQGEDIAEIAKNSSEDPGTAQNGGYFAFTSEDSVDQAYMEATFALEAGQYTHEPVLSQYGYHIIKLEAVAEKPLEEVQEEISSALLNQKQAEAFTSYQEDLKSKAEIVRYDDQKDDDSASVQSDGTESEK